MLVPAGVEEALFKPTANGWIFSGPNPLLFARRPTYLVDDALKAKLARLVRRGRYYRLIALISLIVLLFAALLYFPSLIRAPSLSTWLVLALFPVVSTIALNLCDWLPLRPLLAGLPRTTERISLLEMHDRQAQSMSVKALATLTAIQFGASFFNLWLWLLLPRSNAFVLIGAVCVGLIGALFLAMLVAKLRAQRATA
jgi:hypothetical protein